MLTASDMHTVHNFLNVPICKFYAKYTKDFYVILHVLHFLLESFNECLKSENWPLHWNNAWLNPCFAFIANFMLLNIHQWPLYAELVQIFSCYASIQIWFRSYCFKCGNYADQRQVYFSVAAIIFFTPCIIWPASIQMFHNWCRTSFDNKEPKLHFLKLFTSSHPQRPAFHADSTLCLYINFAWNKNLNLYCFVLYSSHSPPTVFTGFQIQIIAFYDERPWLKYWVNKGSALSWFLQSLLAYIKTIYFYHIYEKFQLSNGLVQNDIHF